METLPVLHDGEYFEETRERDITIITFEDKRIDAAGQISTIKGDLLALAGEGYRRMLLDFQKVQYASAVFISVLQELRRQNVEIVLCSCGPQLLDLLGMTRLLQEFKCYQDRAAALREMCKT